MHSELLVAAAETAPGQVADRRHKPHRTLAPLIFAFL
jgi:hypothetical protein